MNSHENLSNTHVELDPGFLINNHNQQSSKNYINHKDITSIDTLQLTSGVNSINSTSYEKIGIPVENHRAIVFKLDSSNNWIQLVIGLCSYTEKLGENLISVRNEENNEVFYSTIIGMDTVYRQENGSFQYISLLDTIIAWTDDFETDYALSFEDRKGCDCFWNKISALQLACHSETPESECSFSDADTNTIPQFELPSPNLGALSQILTLIQQSLAPETSWVYRSWLVKTLTSSNCAYISSLFDVFQTAEDLESTQDISTIASIFSIIIPLIMGDCLEFFLTEDNFIILCSIYDYINVSSKSQSYKQAYSHSSPSIFFDVGHPSPKLDLSVKRTFRAQFIRDMILARKSISDEIYALLNRFIQESYDEIYSALLEDSDLITIISIRLKDVSCKLVSFSIITFLNELFRVLNTTGKEHLLYKLLSISDLLLFIDIQLPRIKENVPFCISLVEVFQKIFNFYSSQVRAFIMKDSDHNPGKLPILSSIVSIFITTNDSGLQWTCFQCLKIVLCSSVSEVLEIDEFLGKIYSSTLVTDLFAPLKLPPDMKITELQFILLQLFSLFISSHGYRFKYLVLNTPILKEYVSRYLILLESYTIEDKKALLSAIAILRQIIELGDEFYNRLLVKLSRVLLDPLIGLLFTLSKSNDLLSSSLFDLFEAIGTRKENAHLYSYFNRRFYIKLKSLSASTPPLLEKTSFYSNLKAEEYENEENNNDCFDEHDTPIDETNSDNCFLPLNIDCNNEIYEEPVWSAPTGNFKKSPKIQFGQLSMVKKDSSKSDRQIDLVADGISVEKYNEHVSVADLTTFEQDSIIVELKTEENISKHQTEKSEEQVTDFVSLDPSSSIILSPPKKLKHNEYDD